MRILPLARQQNLLILFYVGDDTLLSKVHFGQLNAVSGGAKVRDSEFWFGGGVRKGSA